MASLYRSPMRNHQPNGTPFKVCDIAAPWRALAEDHRYLALAELREGDGIVEIPRTADCRAERVFISIL